jgi:hypothetical protein
MDKHTLSERDGPGCQTPQAYPAHPVRIIVGFAPRHLAAGAAALSTLSGTANALKACLSTRCR